MEKEGAGALLEYGSATPNRRVGGPSRERN